MGGGLLRADGQTGMTKMTVASRNFVKAPKNVSFAITLFNLKSICKQIKRKAALDLPVNKTSDLLIVKGKKTKLSRA